MFEVRTTGRTPLEAIRFADEIATAHRWPELAALLAWCRAEMHL